MNWGNLGKYEAIRQSQLESEYKCPVTTPLIHFHSHCVVMFPPSYLCILCWSHHNTFGWDTQKDILHCNVHFCHFDIECSHLCRVHHTKHNHHDNAHTPAGSYFQSSHQDNHPHTDHHGESSKVHSLGRRRRWQNHFLWFPKSKYL